MINSSTSIRLYIAKILRVAKHHCQCNHHFERLYIAKILRVAKRHTIECLPSFSLYIAKILRVAKLSAISGNSSGVSLHSKNSEGSKT